MRKRIPMGNYIETGTCFDLRFFILRYTYLETYQNAECKLLKALLGFTVYVLAFPCFQPKCYYRSVNQAVEIGFICSKG